MTFKVFEFLARLGIAWLVLVFLVAVVGIIGVMLGLWDAQQPGSG